MRKRSGKATPRKQGASTNPPPEAREMAEQIMADWDGVVGVAWGSQTRQGRRLRKRGLSVHVEKKRLPVELLVEELLPEEVGGERVDVVEVERPRQDALSHRDALRYEHPGFDRTSTIAAFAQGDDGAYYALTVGHGALPLVGGRIVRRYPPHRSQPTLFALDHYEPDGGPYRVRARLIAGAMGNGWALDYALLRIEDPAAISLYHEAAIQRSPITYRDLHYQPLSVDERLFHVSIHQDRGDASQLVEGRADPVLLTPYIFEGSDGSDVTYRDLIIVEPANGEPFSRRGESGSLVVDVHENVVGIAIGSTPSGSKSYVAPVGPMISALGDRASWFFWTA